MKRACLCLIALISISVCAQITNDPGDLPNSKLMKLKMTNIWQDVAVDLIVPGSTSTLSAKKTTSQKIYGKRTEYRGVAFPRGHSLAAISDPNTKKTYIIRGDQDFYISDKSGMIGCRQLMGTFIWIKSYFEIPTASGKEEAAISQFVSEFDDEKLSQEDNKFFRVLLMNAAPVAFFTAGSRGGSQPGTQTIKAIDVTDGILRLDLLSEGGKFTGSFWIDLKKQKIIKSIIDGQEMDLNTGTPFAVPLKLK